MNRKKFKNKSWGSGFQIDEHWKLRKYTNCIKKVSRLKLHLPRHKQ